MSEENLTTSTLTVGKNMFDMGEGTLWQLLRACVDCIHMAVSAEPQPKVLLKILTSTLGFFDEIDQYTRLYFQ